MNYVALLRGVNVGGKNKVSMAELKVCFETLGYETVSTYINSGNILFSSKKSESILEEELEAKLITTFQFDSELIKTLVISQDRLKEVIEHAPADFGGIPHKYYSDVAFLIRVSSQEAFDQFEVNPEVDKVWQGKDVIYYQRLGAKRTSSRLSKIVGKPIYKSMTIRNWNTVCKLAVRLSEM